MGWLIRTIRKRTITKTEIAFQTHSIFSEIELLERRSGRYASTAEEEKISKVGVEVERISTHLAENKTEFYVLAKNNGAFKRVYRSEEHTSELQSLG